jgi:serine/threonine-protein kinase RsbW
MTETIMNVDIVVPNQTRYLRLVGNIAEQIAKEVEANEHDRDALGYHLNLVLTEAMANAIEYGDAQKSNNMVKVCLSIENNDLLIRVFDRGEGFDIGSLPTPDAGSLCERGRGMFFIRSLMDSVVYRKSESGNVLEMRKHLD